MYNAFSRSPNSSSSSYSWPSYKGPEWKYLNLTAGEVGLTGTGTMNWRCTFWNDIIKQFITLPIDESINVNL